ncbi:phosphatidylserine/phosphatidylglycerophosphate/cardiolipin synthase family protein, partial [Pseudomonas sp. K5002]|nr:phosphatidylserine/phosphatidylglycerophosphate/cardiolipin synthase family protein [Pseudomonas sp. K5002]
MSGAVFPWRSANRFELMVDGPSFFPRMLKGIAQAEQQVALELYLVEAGAC